MRLKVLSLVFLSVFLATSVFAENVKVDFDINPQTLNMVSNSFESATFANVTYTEGLFDLYAHEIQSHNFLSTMFDNNLVNHIENVDRNKSFTYNLVFKRPLDITGLFYGNYTNGSNRFKTYYFYDEDNVLLKSFTTSIVNSETKYVPLDLKSVKSIKYEMSAYATMTELDFFVDPASLFSSVIDLNSHISYDSAYFTWKNPIDSFFSGNRVYLNDILLHSNSIFNSYNLKDLEFDTDYKFTISAMYDGIEIFYHYTFKTLPDPGDITPPLDSTSFDLLPFLNAVELSFKPSLSDDVSHYKLYRNGVLIKDNLTDLKYLDENLDEYTSYVYKLTVVDKSGNESKGVSKTVKTLTSADLVPPAEVKNLKIVEDYTVTSRSLVEQLNAKITFDVPDDSDFSHVVLVRDGVVLTDNLTSNIFLDVRLKEMTSYSYKLHTVDLNGNRSPGVTVNFKTSFIPDDIAPVPPIDLVVVNGNASGKVSWLKNTEIDLDGYHVYLDGVKVTTDPIKSTSFSFRNLVNGTSYDVQVTAVDWSGNESAKSLTVTLLPDLSAPTVVDLNDSYELKDVAVFTSGLFGSLWWIVAFIVGLVVAFLVGRRFKELFVGS